MTEEPTMWRPLALGFVTGLRSQLPIATLAWRQARGQLPAEVRGPGRILRRRGSPTLLALAAAGEMVADKLPMTPSRLESGPFTGRLSLGAGAGAGVATAFGRSRLFGGVLGVAGAAAGSWAGTRYRTWAAEHTAIPDLARALCEDAAALTLALVATRPAG